MLQRLCDVSFPIPAVLICARAELCQAVPLLQDFFFKRPQKGRILFAGVDQNHFLVKIVLDARAIVDARELGYGPVVSRAGASWKTFPPD